MFVMLSVRTSTVRERRAETGKKVTTTITNYINNNIDKVLNYKKTTKKLLSSSTTTRSSSSSKSLILSPVNKETTPTSITFHNNNNNNKSKTLQYSSLLSIDKITSGGTILTENLNTFDTLSIAEATAQVATVTTNIAITGKIRSAIARKTLKGQKIRTKNIKNKPIIIGLPTTSVIQEQQEQFIATSKKKTFLLAELNNFKQPPAVQVPVATILNDLSPVPAPAKVKNKKVFNPISPMTPKGLQNNTPDVKAMRYYRLWIYTCNAVLLMAVIVFCGVAGKVLLADYKRLLINGLNLGQPSFIYAYLALLVQSGFLQLIGCLGALRLSEKLLNAYWLLLLVLLIGDAILGIFWMFKFDRVMNDLQPMLRNRLATEYSNSLEFTELWDRLQSEGKCCGIIGAQDFTTTASTSTSQSGSTTAPTNRSYPSSCCSSDMSEQITITRRPLASAVVFRTDDNNLVNNNNNISNQKNNLTDMVDLTWTHVVTAARGETKVVTTCRTVYPQGCLDKVVSWLKNTADILFVIGYCVIAFLKLCFLGILRYEIKEMIQKIKLLQTEMACAILGQDNEQQTQPLQQIPNVINGGIHTEPKVGNRDRERTRIGSGESERESLLTHELNTPKYLKHKQLYTCAEQTAAGDSDTNSSCALIVDESNPQQTKTINGNNNYELSEFDTKAPTYRLLNAPTVTKI